MTQYQGHPDQRYGHITYSQHGEDLMILNIFDQLGIKTGRYLDLGAHHPTTISNTKLLYDRGWRGVNVEANPNLIEAFQLERPEDINVCCAVAPTEGESTFYMYDDYSGLNTLVKPDYEPQKTITVRTKTLNQIVDEYCGGKFPQLLLIDVEDLDYDVLSSSDFVSFYGPRVICSEVRMHDVEKMDKMMNRKSYRSVARMGENEIYVGF